MASHEGTSDNILKVIPIEIPSKLCLMLKRERDRVLKSHLMQLRI